MRRTFGEWAIHWMWFLRVETHPDGTVTIERYWREHASLRVLSAEASQYEATPFRLREGEGRGVTSVWFDNTEHVVRNPGYIFSFD